MAAVVERVLAGLDEDLLEYVTGLCEDTDDDADLADARALALARAAARPRRPGPACPARVLRQARYTSAS